MNKQTNKPVQGHLANKCWWQLSDLNLVSSEPTHLTSPASGCQDTLPGNLAKSEISDQRAASAEAAASPHVINGAKYLK